MRNHLKRQTWCPCKDAEWTIEKAKEGQTDGRFVHCNPVNNDNAIAGNNNNNAITGNNNNLVNINIHIDASKILPSGSEAERIYLKEHAESILKSIVAGAQGPEADILSRFVRETWCSEIHERLNNVLSLDNNKHQYIVLQMQNGKPQIETLAGIQAPEQLVKIAQEVMHRFAVDSCGGYDPSKLTLPDYGMTCDTESEAVAMNKEAGKGKVCQMKVWGSSERHKGQFDTFWVNRVDVNGVPQQIPTYMEEAKHVAGVDERLRGKKRDRQRVEKVVCAQLRQVDEKRDKKQKLLSVVRKSRTQ